MAYFKALSKIISESGGPFLLQECQVSIKSFLSGLSYNKRKLLHEILATAFEFMHFKTLNIGNSEQPDNKKRRC